MAENSLCAKGVSDKSRAVGKSLEFPRTFNYQKIQKGWNVHLQFQIFDQNMNTSINFFRSKMSPSHFFKNSLIPLTTKDREPGFPA